MKTFLAVCFALFAIGVLLGVTARPTPPRERTHVFRPETHEALRELHTDLHALSDEARCRSNAERAAAGECDQLTGHREPWQPKAVLRRKHQRGEAMR